MNLQDNTGRIQEYINSAEMIDFYTKNATFFSVAMKKNDTYCKNYINKNVKDKLLKIEKIHNALYSKNPYKILESDIYMISQPILEGYVTLDKKEDIYLYKSAGKHLADFHMFLDQHFSSKTLYPTIYDKTFYESLLKVLMLLDDYGIMSKSVVKKLYNELLVSSQIFRMNELGGIHADIHKKNIMTDGQKIQFIDFDMIGYGNRLLDFAVFYSATNKQVLQFHYFLDGYFSRKKISCTWQEFRNACLLARFLCISSNLNNINNYWWLLDYIEITSSYLDMTEEIPPAELRSFF